MRNVLLMLFVCICLGAGGCVQQTTSSALPSDIEKIVKRDEADGKTLYRYEPRLSATSFQPVVIEKDGAKTLKVHLVYSTQTQVLADTVRMVIDNGAPVEIAAVLDRSEKIKDKYASAYEESLTLSGMTPDKLTLAAGAKSVVFRVSGQGGHDISLTAPDQEGIRWLLSVLQKTP